MLVHESCKIVFILFALGFLNFSYSQVNYQTRYIELTWEEIVENETDDEKKIDSFIFYSFVHYKKDIYSGGDGSDIFNEFKNLKDFYRLNNKNQIYIQIRLNVKSQDEAYPIKTELESLGCDIIKEYAGHNNYIELSAWAGIDKIIDIARTKNVVNIKSFSPIFYR